MTQCDCIFCSIHAGGFTPDVSDPVRLLLLYVLFYPCRGFHTRCVRPCTTIVTVCFVLSMQGVSHQMCQTLYDYCDCMFCSIHAGGFTPDVSDHVWCPKRFMAYKFSYLASS